jgi:hypothetical protein
MAAIINILLVAIITATLLTGTSVIPMQSFADKGNDDDHKKTKDFKSKVSASYDSSKKSADQHMDQDNFCYRGDDCEQANQGQQIVGKDNDAKGFNDQSDNLELTIPGTGNGNGNGNGGTPQEECLLCIAEANLTDFFNETAVITLGIETEAQLCAALVAGTLPTAVLLLLVAALDAATEQCLIDAGITLRVGRV